MEQRSQQNPSGDGILTRDIHLSHTAVFCFALGGFMAFVAVPLKALKLHATSVEMGVVSTAALFVYALCCVALMPLSSRISPKRSVLFGCASNIVLLLGASSSHTIPQLIVTVVLLGATWSFFWPPVMAWMSRSVSEARLPRELSNFNQAWCLGDILGAAFGGWISQQFSTRAVFLGGACLSAVALMLTSQRRGIHCEAHGDPVESSNPEGVPLTAKKEVAGNGNRFAYLAWIGLGATFLSHGCFYGLFPLIARTRVGFSDSNIGGCFAMMGVCQFLMFQIVKKWHGWRYRFAAAALPNLCMILAALILAHARHGGAMVAAALIAPIGVSMNYSASIYYGATGGFRKMTAMSVHESLLGCCLFAGGLLGGGLAKRFPMAMPFYVVSSVMALVTLVQYRLGWMGQVSVPASASDEEQFAECVDVLEPVP